MAWVGVITNKGNELLAQWVAGKTLTVTRAAAGTGTVSEAALMAQTALVSEKQTASIVSNETVAEGRRIALRITAQQIGYEMNQMGIWAALDSGTAQMIAIFQTEAAVEIPSSADVPDFVYTFYALLQFSGSGELSVTIDAEALLTKGELDEAMVLAEAKATELANAAKESAIAQAQLMAYAAESNAKAASAPRYSATATYAANEWVVHKGEVWRNTSGQSVTGVEPGTDYNKWNVGFSNENLADNGWFQVNQSGQSEYLVAVTNYTVDRWRFTGGELQSISPISPYGMIYKSSHRGAQFSTYLDGPKFKVGIYTISAKIDGLIYSLSANYTGVTDQSASYESYGRKSFAIPGKCTVTCEFRRYSTTRNLEIVFVGYPTEGIEVSLAFECVKLELGPISTIANDGPPDYATELLKCKSSTADTSDPYANQALGSNTISDAWRSSKTYYMGDFCIYQNKLWKCKTQHSNHKPEEGTYWSEVSIMGELTPKNRTISGYLEATKIGGIVVVNGYVADLSLSSSLTKIGDLPSDIPKPRTAIRAVCNVGQDAYTAEKQGCFIIYPTGEVRAATSSGTATTVYVSCSYAI